MTSIKLIGDLHIGHSNILKYRKFDSIEEHDGLLLENINSSISKRDILVLLGDCFFTEESLNFLRGICYKKGIYYVLGNHDFKNNKCHDILKTIIKEDLVSKVIGLHKHKGVWFSHAPIYEGELRGCLNCHGHVHVNTIEDYRYANLSCENVSYKPVSLEVIRQYYLDKEIFRG